RRVFIWSSTTKTTLPPVPPSPPSGPPAAMYFSRWKCTAPSPPLPAFILILTISTNIVPPRFCNYYLQKRGRQSSAPPVLILTEQLSRKPRPSCGHGPFSQTLHGR